VRSVVVKLGTQLLSKGGGDRTLDTAFIGAVAGQIARLREAGVRVTVVSSGAVGAGMARLKLGKRPDDLATLQAVAAVGQPRLMTAWADALSPHGLSAAQILLTREDIDHRLRFLNLRNTLAAAETLGAVPVINENDTVSTDEMVRISFGDNDLLAALVAQAIGAQLLVLLSVVDGLLDPAGKPLRLVTDLEHAQSLVRPEKSASGKGGMDSKLNAASILTRAGECLVVADGRTPEVLPRILKGEEIGTLFVPAVGAGRGSGGGVAKAGKTTGRNRWIASARPSGTVTVDEGAAKALARGKSSLLPAGITGVEGDFDRGDLVHIVSAAGVVLAKGLSNYPAEQVRQIQGKKSADVRKLFQDNAYDEVVHRDNMVLLKPSGSGDGAME
jgi:glutamate 5-kinase